MKLTLVLLSLFILAGLSSSYPQLRLYAGPPDGLKENSAKACGYQGCVDTSDNSFTYLHLVPHSHDDVGWLKTVDQYFFGARNEIQDASVENIYDSVVMELEDDPEKRFVAVEMEFFWRWWKNQEPATQDLVQTLVQEGRLEFVGAGWCMNDEAGAYYIDIIDQMTYGLKFVNATFGECGVPKTVWQVDPFGHSKEQASIFARMGFEGMFFGRLDYQDKIKRKADKSMEMNWKSGHYPEDDIFTGVLYNMYQPPPGFCFDVFCRDEPIIEDVESVEYNADRRIEEFLEYTREEANAYQTNHLMFTMGSDFHYQFAHQWYKNLDLLIKHINKNTATHKFKAVYSTPSCYLKAVKGSGVALPEKTDDFFPYGSDPHSYWTGYFTSRPTLKGMIRDASKTLQACKQLESLVSKNGPSKNLEKLVRAVAINQHHDAVTGTAKQHVTDDYYRLLHIGMESCKESMSSAMNTLMKLEIQLPEQKFCTYTNISACATTESSTSFAVNVYNQISETKTFFVRLPVVDGTYSIVGPDGSGLPADLIPIPNFIMNIEGRESLATHELVFAASDVPPLGVKSYHVTRSAIGSKALKVDSAPLNGNFSVVRGGVSITILNGKISDIATAENSVKLGQDFMFYVGQRGNNDGSVNRASGAYIFRPDGVAATVSENVEAASVEGLVVTEIWQSFGTYVHQVVRMYGEEKHVEFQWVVGPIPVDDEIGKEVVTRFTSEVASEGTFYTDSNGRQTVLRQRDYRLTWELENTEPIASNYYPLNSHIFIKDVASEVGLVVDRAQGGSSLADGAIEVMVHRRLLDDDAFGVGEALNEPGFSGNGLVATGKHYLTFNLDGTKPISEEYRKIQQSINKGPIISFMEISRGDWDSNVKKEVTSLAESLPSNVQILTLEPWKEGVTLLRLEHLFEPGEHPVWSADATVNLAALSIDIGSVEELNLAATGNVPSENDWMLADDTDVIQLAGFEVNLKPLEIRTFALRPVPVMNAAVSLSSSMFGFLLAFCLLLLRN